MHGCKFILFFRVSLCCPGCPAPLCVAQAVLTLTDISFCDLPVRFGLKSWLRNYVINYSSMLLPSNTVCVCVAMRVNRQMGWKHPYKVNI